MRKQSSSPEKDEKNTDEKRLNKEQIAALKLEKKKTQEELDELQGKTTGGKIACFLAFLGILVVLGGVFVGLVKLNVGNFASDILAPVIGNVPVARSILPKEYQEKTAAERKAEEQAAADAAAQAASEQAAAEEAAAAAQQQAADEAAAAQAASEQAAAEEAASEQAVAEEAASEQAAADEAALADYVNTYSQMKPKAAAQVFDNMMTDQSDLVVKILSNMTPDQRAAIISNMSVANASEVTVKMEQ